MIAQSERHRSGVGRVRGRGAIVRSLRWLLIRVYRFGSHRATSQEECAWAARLADDLSSALRAAVDSPAVVRSLRAVDERAALVRKGTCDRQNLETAGI